MRDLLDGFGERPVVAEGEREERDERDGEEEEQAKIEGKHPAQRGRRVHFYPRIRAGFREVGLRSLSQIGRGRRREGLGIGRLQSA